MLRGNLSHWETDGLFGSDDDATPVIEYFTANQSDGNWVCKELQFVSDNDNNATAKDRALQIAKDISICGYVNAHELAYYINNPGLISYVYKNLDLIAGTLDNGVYPVNICSDILAGCHRSIRKNNFLRCNLGDKLMNILDASYCAIEHNDPNVGVAIVTALKLYYRIGMDYRDISITIGVPIEYSQWLLNTGIRLMSQIFIKNNYS